MIFQERGQKNLNCLHNLEACVHLQSLEPFSRGGATAKCKVLLTTALLILLTVSTYCYFQLVCGIIFSYIAARLTAEPQSLSSHDKLGNVEYCQCEITDAFIYLWYTESFFMHFLFYINQWCGMCRVCPRSLLFTGVFKRFWRAY